MIYPRTPTLPTSRPRLPSTIPPTSDSNTNPLPITLSTQNRPSVLRNRPLSQRKFGKEKVPRLITWDRNIVCLPKNYHGKGGNRRVLPIPKGKARISLQARGLCGKIRLHSEMSESEVSKEVRSTFQDAMGQDSNFPFCFLQTGGGGTKSLTMPAVSSSFTWTAKEVAKLSGQGCLYIQAEAELAKADYESDKEIYLTKDEEHDHKVLIYIYVYQ